MAFYELMMGTGFFGLVAFLIVSLITGLLGRSKWRNVFEVLMYGSNSTTLKKKWALSVFLFLILLFIAGLVGLLLDTHP
ncbi:MAG: hypothetical protein ACI9ES_002405 [Oceanospirillaceae bacterium]|jgi:hypothetical protein